MLVDLTRLTTKQQAAIARVTFPTKRDTASHYPTVFTDGATTWRVFHPSVPEQIQRQILDLLKK